MKGVEPRCTMAASPEDRDLPSANVALLDSQLRETAAADTRTKSAPPRRYASNALLDTDLQAFRAMVNSHHSGIGLIAKEMSQASML